MDVAKAIQKIHQDTAHYYTQKLREYGPCARGVDWKDSNSQTLSFRKLIQAWDLNSPFSVNDLGCGYGEFFRFLKDSIRAPFKYRGYDLSKSMIEKAREIFNSKDAQFRLIRNSRQLIRSDYSVASGIFNVKMEHSTKNWKSHILETIDNMNEFSTKGFAFNMLSLYSDKHKRRNDLYYGDPLLYFDLCKRLYSKYVTLLHDYPSYEFTLIVHKERKGQGS